MADEDQKQGETGGAVDESQAKEVLHVTLDPGQIEELFATFKTNLDEGLAALKAEIAETIEGSKTGLEEEIAPRFAELFKSIEALSEEFEARLAALESAPQRSDEAEDDASDPVALPEGLADRVTALEKGLAKLQADHRHGNF